MATVFHENGNWNYKSYVIAHPVVMCPILSNNIMYLIQYTRIINYALRFSQIETGYTL